MEVEHNLVEHNCLNVEILSIERYKMATTFIFPDDVYLGVGDPTKSHGSSEKRTNLTCLDVCLDIFK